MGQDPLQTQMAARDRGADSVDNVYHVGRGTAYRRHSSRLHVRKIRIGDARGSDSQRRRGRRNRVPYPAGSRTRLIVEIAIATNTAPADWYDEDDRTIATVLDVMQIQAADMERRTRRGK